MDGAADLAVAVLEHLDEPVIACDSAGHVVFVNELARALQPDGSRLYHAGTDRLVGDDEMPLWRALRGARVTGVELDVEADGAPRRRVSVSGRPLRSSDGTMVGAVVTLRDVDVDGTAETALHDAIRSSVGGGIALVRASDGVLVEVDDSWARIFGYVAAELVGRHVSVVTAGGDRTPREIVGALERDGRWRGEIENVRKDGRRIWCSAELAPFEHPEHGSVWVAVQVDITARKRAELALRQDEERFRTVFEAGPVGIVVLGPQGRVVEANEAFSALVGYGRDEVVGMTLDELTHPDDRGVGSDLAARARSGELRRYSVAKRFVTKSGAAVAVNVTATMVRDPSDRPLYELALVEETSARGAAANGHSG